MPDSQYNLLSELIGALVEGTGSAEHSYVGIKPKGVLETRSVSLLFDRGRFEIENPFDVRFAEICISSRSDEITEALDRLLGRRVVDAYISREEIVLGFEDNAFIRISLKDEDYIGPEAGSYTPKEGTIIVFD